MLSFDLHCAPPRIAHRPTKQVTMKNEVITMGSNPILLASYKNRAGPGITGLLS